MFCGEGPVRCLGGGGQGICLLFERNLFFCDVWDENTPCLAPDVQLARALRGFLVAWTSERGSGTFGRLKPSSSEAALGLTPSCNTPAFAL